MGLGVVGKDAKSYYNTGTNATPTWVNITGVIDVSVSLDAEEAEFSSRRSNWKSFGQGLKEFSVSMGYRHQAIADTVFDALLAMFISATVRQLAFVDAAIATTATQGLKAYMVCTAMPQEQSLSDGLSFTFTFRPALFEEPAGTIIDPVWVEIP